jgi:membrane protein DedA with SNARE-associated domain
MEIGPLIEQYGYWAIAAGALLEGETVVALGGLAARLGHLKLPYVILVAALAGCCGDQLFFWLGRKNGARILARFEFVAARSAKLNAMIERYHEWVIVGVRFAYGIRIAGPILIGMSKVPGSRFVLFNAFGALLWAVLIATLGWAFGTAVEAMLGRLRGIEEWLFVGLAVAGIGFWFFRRWRASRKS